MKQRIVADHPKFVTYSAEEVYILRVGLALNKDSEAYTPTDIRDVGIFFLLDNNSNTILSSMEHSHSTEVKAYRLLRWNSGWKKEVERKLSYMNLENISLEALFKPHVSWKETTWTYNKKRGAANVQAEQTITSASITECISDSAVNCLVYNNVVNNVSAESLDTNIEN